MSGPGFEVYEVVYFVLDKTMSGLVPEFPKKYEGKCVHTCIFGFVLFL